MIDHIQEQGEVESIQLIDAPQDGENQLVELEDMDEDEDMDEKSDDD